MMKIKLVEITDDKSISRRQMFDKGSKAISSREMFANKQDDENNSEGEVSAMPYLWPKETKDLPEISLNSMSFEKSKLQYPNDPFMNKELVKERLWREFRKYGKLIIAYDFDYTVHNYKNESYDYRMVVNLLRDWRKYAHFIVFSASPEHRYKYIKEYLDRNNIPFDTINAEVLDRNSTRKVYYNVLLDDRAGLCETVLMLREMIDKIKEIDEKVNRS